MFDLFADMKDCFNTFCEDADREIDRLKEQQKRELDRKDENTD